MDQSTFYQQNQSLISKQNKKGGKIINGYQTNHAFAAEDEIIENFVQMNEKHLIEQRR